MDMASNCTMRLSLEGQEKGSNLKEMRSTIIMLGFSCKNYILSVVKNNFSRNGRPIPVGLQDEA